jgi:hypothetical protein
MEYHLTFYKLVLGSLTFCLTLLATAWTAAWIGRSLHPPGQEMDRLELGHVRRRLMRRRVH